MSLRDMPEIISITLTDYTTNKNIIWATDNYGHPPESHIQPDQINDIIPRSQKDAKTQKQRTRDKAEVFTPLWIVKDMNDQVDKSYENDDLYTYINRNWLEITCGEAPFIVSRYNMENGKEIPLLLREGFLDRKLRRINQEDVSLEEWQNLVEQAYMSSYGYEWSGDSLFLARENLMYTYYDYHQDKFPGGVSEESFKRIAQIVARNVIQMDGLKFTIPMTDIPATTMNWETQQMEAYADEI